MRRFLVLLVVLLQLQLASSQHVTKTVIHFCDPKIPKSCGEGGECLVRRTGNRCRCPHGLMGRGCQRPCQDVYQSCARWHEQKRCHWARPISPFFMDNCALSCGVCTSDGTRLEIPLPPILDPVAWLVGRWETKTTSGDRFPEPLSGPYKEVLDVQISEVPSFDRPPVNISVLAVTMDGTDVHRELGFMTGKPFLEDTGFVEFDKPETGDDLVAIEMTSNTGITTIEEGIAVPGQIILDVTYQKSLLPERSKLKTAKRSFRLLSPEMLEERTVYSDSRGVTKKWLKRYKKIHDYFKDIRRV